MKYTRLILFSLLLSCVIAFAEQVYDRYPFTDSHKEQQFYQLLKKLRCLVCQNQDLLDSNASLAEDLRSEIYKMIQAGESNNEVIAFLTSRYGDVVLFLPPFNQLTLLLWVGPFTLLLPSIGLLFYGIKRRNKLSQRIS